MEATISRHGAIIGGTLIAMVLGALVPVHSGQQSGSSTFEGIVRGKPTRQLVLPAPDRPRHILGLVETEGLYEDADKLGFLAGASVRTVEAWDLMAGSGSDRGFMAFTVGNDTLVGSYSGQVKPADGGRSALSGEIQFETGSGVFAGIRGAATYTGLADAQSFELRINGRYQK